MNKSLKILLSVVFFILFVLLIIVFAGAKLYTDILWFNNLNYLKTFLTMFFANFWLRLLIGSIFSLFIYINLFFTKSTLLDYIKVRDNQNMESLFKGIDNNFLKWINKKRINYLYILLSIVLGFLFSSINQDLWKIVLKYFNSTTFATQDPIFNKDIAFYVFSLPFFNFIREMGMVLVILTLIVVGIIYILSSGINSFNDIKIKLNSRSKTHITMLFILFLFLKAWDYRLSMYNLLYSPRGVVFGAGYTDINANLIGLKILYIITFIISIILIINIFRKSYKIIIWVLGLWLFSSFIFGNIYPAFVQKFQVEPNEIVKESEYINYHIDMTLKAYGLDKVNIINFDAENNLTYDDLLNNQDTINNIRLWDERPLLSTYSQLQELRQYYSFINVDIDRYYINGEYRQVMLAARELDQNRLSSQAKTWINQTLKYTHGYGVVMNPVNLVTSEGLPEFFLKDIPPKSSTDLSLENPAIYYGEKTDNYVIVNTKSKEFDYPMGDKNAYVNYSGNGGVPLDNFFKKILYAIRYKNIKFLLADDITKESRIMYYRNIKERVSKVAPFLSFDSDPYQVIYQGNLYWIIDAYTVSDRYPYSQPIANLGNYIKNSIKIVINAYNGKMKFYIVDKNDPLAITYQKIFPDLFVSGDEVPEGLRQHFRIPMNLFDIKAQLFSTYHMKNPTVFYNKEDLWNIPQENYAGTSITMEPYYTIMQIPGEKKAEFVLMLPFTPATKNNMISWMLARMDGEHYGEILVYKLPKDALVYGPMQIESRIDQDSDISQLLTLWSQRGSRVIRGKIFLIPIEKSLLYVEPIYLQAETSELPELKRIVVAYENKIVIAERLDQALNIIFGISQEKEIIQENLEIPAKSIEELSTRALDVYNKAQDSLKNGNWSRYGELLNQLQNILEELNQLN